MIIPSPIKQAISGIGGVYEYTLLEQPSITVSQFRTLADEYRKRQLGSEFDVDQSDEVCDELARKFWRRLGPTMEPPIYGADMEGTLFNKDAYACGWNVNRLESCLCLLRADVKDGEGGGGGDDEEFHLPGVTSAYLYFGMWASAFAAHTEDMNLLSINYLHAGSPKYWYGIAREDSKRFESLAQSHFVGRASECSEFLRHKRCLLSPAILRKAGIKFTTCVQRPGDASELFRTFMCHLILHRQHAFLITLDHIVVFISYNLSRQLSLWIQYRIQHCRIHQLCRTGMDSTGNAGGYLHVPSTLGSDTDGSREIVAGEL